MNTFKSTAFGESSEVEIQLRSHIRGRERWDTPQLRNRPNAAALLERILARETGIISVSANPTTARVLVLFGEENTSIGPLLRRAINEVLRRSELADVARMPMLARGTIFFVRTILGGGSLLWVVVALRAPPLTFALLAGVAIVGTTTLVLRSWQKSRVGVSPVVRMFQYAGPHRRRIQFAVAVSVLDKFLDLAPALLIGTALNVIALKPSPLFITMGIVTVKLQLLAIGVATVAIWLMETVTGYAQRYLWQSVARDLQNELRLEVYGHIQRLNMEVLESRRSGDLVTILSDDINRIHAFIADDANHVIQVGTNAVVLGLIFIVVAPSIGWLALLPLPFVIWATLRYQDEMRPIYGLAQTRAGELSAQVVNNFSGISTIKSFTAEDHEFRRIQELSREHMNSTTSAVEKSSLFSPLIRLPILAGFAGTMVAGGFAVLSGTLDMGTYAAVVFLTQRFLWPLTSLGRSLDSYQRAVAGMERVLDILEVPASVHDSGEPMPKEAVRGEIVFEDVRFAYREGADVLCGLNLKISAGSTVAIVGPTGSGKSTMIKLLLRFHENYAGVIYLDGRNIRSLSALDIRRAIGLVSQDLFLIDAGIRENIDLGRPGAPFEAIENAARIAEADDFIGQQPKGYETQVGERGTSLSAGQRQRICIARAVLKDPPIFIFDEATSAVDYETEAAIQRSLELISKDRTTIIVAHRLSTVRAADRIYVLGMDGRLAEDGTHDELMRQDGFYASLWRVHSGAQHYERNRSR